MSKLLACSKEYCYVPETACDEGHMLATDCPHYNGDDQSSSPTYEDEYESFPWTGRPLGLNDLRFISATRRPHIIGIAGAANAGKTTLLSLLFLNLYRGRILDSFSFAGSYTLMGWDNIARNLQLNAGENIRFPPHTSSAGRAPGLLHLCMKESKGNLQDLLLTDASGEWFSAWTENPEDERAEGARWIANYADRMLIVADTEALIGANRGSAKLALEFLIRRVQHDFGKGGVALVWTKTDLGRPPLKGEIENLFTSCFGDAPIFETSIPDEKTNGNGKTLKQLTELFAWAFTFKNHRITLKLPDSRSTDAFLSYRGNNP